MINYYPMWDRLNRIGKRQRDLLSILSPATVNKLRKNQTVTTETIDKLCKFLNCQPGQIIEYQEDPAPEIKTEI